MESVLAEIRNRLKTSRFANEASVSQGIVLPILNELGWDVFNVDIVSPEYALEGRRVDFALCHPAKRPQVFFEIKQVGQSVNTERQLFEYAFHSGIPMAVLTDGREWGFFLPGEQGSYDERRVYKLDILERDITETIERLQRYLAYSRVRSGEAIEAARQDYRNAAKAREAKSTLPSAWAKIIEEQDELLIELLAAKVESMCGYKPDARDVVIFLSQLQSNNYQNVSTVPSPKMQIKPVGRRNQSISFQQTATASTLEWIGFVFHGKEYRTNKGSKTLVQLFNLFSEEFPQFLENFYKLDEPTEKRKRRYLGKQKSDLNPDGIYQANQLQSGWWLDTKYGINDMETIARLACKAAGIEFGTDLKIRLK
jgi:predicted type IV restriction endonuclease